MLRTILNRDEEAVSARLKSVCDAHGAHVYAKLRVADVLKLDNSGIASEDYSFGLKSHFDFIIADREHYPLFAVEFDGPSHDTAVQLDRDAIKDGLARRFDLPLLRVRSGHLPRRYDGWDLLTWIVEVWFLHQAADRMFAAGQLPIDFDFDPALIISSPDRTRRFPYWLGLDAQLAIRRLFTHGHIGDSTPSIYQAVDGRGNHRALACIRIDDDTGVHVSAAMRSQQMRVDLTEAVRGVVLNALLQELERALSDASARVSLPQIDLAVMAFAARYKVLSWCGSAPAK